MSYVETLSPRFTHTSIVARDYKKLASFYVETFGCELLTPERKLAGKWIEEATGIIGASIEGLHLRLPGYEKNGPTLEIFTYSPQVENTITPINRIGLAHIAFHVDDVEAALLRFERAGGQRISPNVVVREITGVGVINFAYARDIDGNIVELQKWCT